MSARRKRRPSPADVHEAIREEAEHLRRAPVPALKDAHETPELAALLHSARATVEGCIPSQFEHEGKTYFLRARLSLILDVFDSAGTPVSLVSGATFSTEGFGHVPGH